MSSTAAAAAEVGQVLAALRAQRLHWVELAPGRKVCFTRPLEAQMHRFVVGITADHVCEFVTGWEGFTQATFLGDAVGSSDPLAFDAELWAEYVRDHADEIAKVAAGMRDAMKARISEREAAAKN